MLSRRGAERRLAQTKRKTMSVNYTVDRKVSVDAPATAVYERIADFHRWRGVAQ
jgi:hypothetical protein